MRKTTKATLAAWVKINRIRLVQTITFDFYLPEQNSTINKFKSKSKIIVVVCHHFSY